MIATVEQLGDALAAAARANGAALTLHRQTADGFGSVGVPVLDVVRADGVRVRVWEEGGRGDFLFEIGADGHVGAWWAERPKRQAELPRVVLELVLGRYEIVDGRVTVRVDGRAVTLRAQL